MGKNGNFAPGKMKLWERITRWVVAALSLVGFLATALYSFWPALRMWLLDEWKLPIFESVHGQEFRDLSVLLLTYVFIALTRKSKWDFLTSLTGFLVSATLWYLGVLGWPEGSTAGLLVAVFTVVFGAFVGTGKVWIWTDVPKHASHTLISTATSPTPTPTPSAG